MSVSLSHTLTFIVGLTPLLSLILISHTQVTIPTSSSTSITNYHPQVAISSSTQKSKLEETGIHLPILQHGRPTSKSSRSPQISKLEDLYPNLPVLQIFKQAGRLTYVHPNLPVLQIIKQAGRPTYVRPNLPVLLR